MKTNFGFALKIECPAFVAAMFSRLESQLPANLFYHSINHTREVAANALMLAQAEGLGARDLELLLIAAVYHDSGFLEQAAGHEELGAAWATDDMQKAHAYSKDEIALVGQMICDTKLGDVSQGLASQPTTRLSAYLLDADLSNFGGDDFLQQMELVRKEKLLPADADYYKGVLTLMQAHQWRSATAIALWSKKKAENMQRLHELCERG